MLTRNGNGPINSPLAFYSKVCRALVRGGSWLIATWGELRMGYDSLLELITEPALIISTSSGLKRNSAWRAVLCEETPTLEGLASFLHCPQLCNIIEECLSRGDERLVDVLVSGGRAQMKIIVLDKQTICCAMISKQSKQYSQLYAARSSTVGVVIDFADTTRPTICWTNKPSIPRMVFFFHPIWISSCIIFS